MGPEKLGDDIPIDAVHRQQLFEKGGHASRVEAGISEDLHPYAVRLLLVETGEIDHPLRAAGHRGSDGCLGQIRVLAAEDHGGQYSCGHGKIHPAGGFAGPGQMALGHVGDLVGQHGGQLAFVPGVEDEAGIDPDVAAGRGEGVDSRILDDEEGEGPVGSITVGDQPPPQILKILGYFRILEQGEAIADITHELCAYPLLLFPGKKGAGAVSHLRQLAVQCVAGGGGDEQAERQNQGGEGTSSHEIGRNDIRNRLSIEAAEEKGKFPLCLC